MKPDGDRVQYVYKLQKLLVEKVITPNSIYLDIGCGPGYVAKYIYGKAKLVVGIDIDDPSGGLRGNALKLPFADNTFDVISSYAMLYLVGFGRDKQVLAEINRVLKPGGHAVLVIQGKPNLNAFYWRWWYQKYKNVKLNCYTLYEAKRLTKGLFAEREFHALGVTDIPRPGWVFPKLFHRNFGPDLDYFLSNLPLLRWFAPNYYFILQKTVPAV